MGEPESGPRQAGSWHARADVGRARGGEATRRRGHRRWVTAAALLAFLPAAALAVGCGDRSAAAHGNRGAVSDTALVRMVADLLPDVERVSGLRALEEPRTALAGRERVRAYLTEQLEDQLPPERAERLTAVYARFGLVPDTLDLVGLLRGLYEEQVVGFYDPVTDTLYVVEGVSGDQLEMVLVHELVHALQDQHVDLDSLTRAVRDRNDLATAVHSAIEGQATLAMLEWQMERMTGTRVDVTRLPDLGEQLAGANLEALAAGSDLPVLGQAPRVVRETLIFPYVGGLSFVQALWRAQPGRPAPFGEHLPRSTREVMHPDQFLGPARRVPVEVRFRERPPAGWDELHADDLGALEIRILLEEHLADAERARQVVAGWSGDRYRLLRGEGGEALIWATAWDGAGEADRFAAAAREAWEGRYTEGGRRVLVERAEVAGLPGVLVLDLPEGLEVGTGWGPARLAPAE